MPFREPGRLLAPLLAWGFIAVVAWWLAVPHSSLPGWQLALLIAAAIPLAGGAAFGIMALLGFLISIPLERGEKLRHDRFRRFVSLLEAPDDPASVEEARSLAERILNEGRGLLRSELEGARPILEAASEPGPLQEECISILLTHAGGGGDQARALFAARDALNAERLDDWVRWFFMFGEPEEDQEGDFRPQAFAYALGRTEGQARRGVLNRLLLGARPHESWWSVAREMDEELRALDPEELAPLEREGLATLLAGPPSS